MRAAEDEGRGGEDTRGRSKDAENGKGSKGRTMRRRIRMRWLAEDDGEK